MIESESPTALERWTAGHFLPLEALFFGWFGKFAARSIRLTDGCPPGDRLEDRLQEASMKRPSRLMPVVLVLPLFALSLQMLPGVTVRVANLRDLIEQSDRIFVGKCLTAVSSLERDIPRMTYTFRVLEPVKGVASETVVVRQFGVAEQVSSGDGFKRGIVIQGMPRYRVGAKYLLFMVAESPIGLSAPAGLFQGAFAAKGGGFVNEIDNRNLTRGLSRAWLLEKGLEKAEVDRIAAFKSGAIESGFLLQIVRSLSR